MSKIYLLFHMYFLKIAFDFMDTEVNQLMTTDDNTYLFLSIKVFTPTPFL